jgi:hypothetical protein
MSSTLHAWRVVILLYMGSRQHSCNLTNMRRKASAGLGLHMAMVPESYQWCPSAFNSFKLPSWMLYQDVQLLWDSGLMRGESGYSL